MKTYSLVALGLVIVFLLGLVIVTAQDKQPNTSNSLLESFDKLDVLYNEVNDAAASIQEEVLGDKDYQINKDFFLTNLRKDLDDFALGNSYGIWGHLQSQQLRPTIFDGFPEPLRSKFKELLSLAKSVLSDPKYSELDGGGYRLLDEAQALIADGRNAPAKLRLLEAVKVSKDPAKVSEAYYWLSVLERKLAGESSGSINPVNLKSAIRYAIKSIESEPTAIPPKVLLRELQKEVLGGVLLNYNFTREQIVDNIRAKLGTRKTGEDQGFGTMFNNWWENFWTWVNQPTSTFLANLAPRNQVTLGFEETNFEIDMNLFGILSLLKFVDAGYTLQEINSQLDRLNNWWLFVLPERANPLFTPEEKKKMLDADIENTNYNFLMKSFDLTEAPTPEVLHRTYGAVKLALGNPDIQILLDAETPNSFIFPSGTKYLEFDPEIREEIFKSLDLGIIAALAFGTSTTRLGTFGKFLETTRFGKTLGITSSSTASALLGLDKLRSILSASKVGTTISQLKPIQQLFITLAGDLSLFGGAMYLDHQISKTGFNPHLSSILMFSYGGQPLLNFADISSRRFQQRLLKNLEREASFAIPDEALRTKFNSRLRPGLENVKDLQALKNLIESAGKAEGVEAAAIKHLTDNAEGLLYLAHRQTMTEALVEAERQIERAALADNEIQILEAVNLWNREPTPGAVTARYVIPDERIADVFRAGGITTELDRAINNRPGNKFLEETVDTFFRDSPLPPGLSGKNSRDFLVGGWLESGTVAPPNFGLTVRVEINPKTAWIVGKDEASNVLVAVPYEEFVSSYTVPRGATVWHHVSSQTNRPPYISSPVLLLEGEIGANKITLASADTLSDVIKSIIARAGVNTVAQALEKLRLDLMQSLSRELKVPPEVYLQFQQQTQDITTQILDANNLRTAPEHVRATLASKPEVVLDGRVVDRTGLVAVGATGRFKGKSGEVFVKIRRDPMGLGTIRTPEEVAAIPPVTRSRMWEETVNDFNFEVEKAGTVSEVLGGEKVPEVHGVVRVGEESNPAIAMEFVEGVSSVQLRRNPHLSAELVTDKARQQAVVVIQRLWERGYVLEDFQYLVLTKDQVVNGKHYDRGDIIIIDFDGLREVGEGAGRWGNKLSRGRAAEVVNDQIFLHTQTNRPLEWGSLQTDVGLSRDVIEDVMTQAGRVGDVEILNRFSGYLGQTLQAVDRVAAGTPVAESGVAKLPRYYRPGTLEDALKIIRNRRLTSLESGELFSNPGLYLAPIPTTKFGDISFVFSAEIEVLEGSVIYSNIPKGVRNWRRLPGKPGERTLALADHLVYVTYTTPGQKTALRVVLDEAGLENVPLVHINTAMNEAKMVRRAVSSHHTELALVTGEYTPANLKPRRLDFQQIDRLLAVDKRGNPRHQKQHIYDALEHGEVVGFSRDVEQSPKVNFENPEILAVVTVRDDKKFLNYIDPLTGKPVSLELLPDIYIFNLYPTDRRLVEEGLEAFLSGEKRLTEVLSGGAAYKLHKLEYGKPSRGDITRLAPQQAEVSAVGRGLVSDYKVVTELPPGVSVVGYEKPSVTIYHPQNGPAGLMTFDGIETASRFNTPTQGFLRVRVLDDGGLQVVSRKIDFPVAQRTLRWGPNTLKMPQTVQRAAGGLRQRAQFIDEFLQEEFVYSIDPEFPYSMLYDLVDGRVSLDGMINFEREHLENAIDNLLNHIVDNRLWNVFDPKSGVFKTDRFWRLVDRETFSGIANDPNWILTTSNRIGRRVVEMPPEEVIPLVNEEIINRLESGFYHAHVSGQNYVLDPNYAGFTQTAAAANGEQVIPVFFHPLIRDEIGAVRQASAQNFHLPYWFDREAARSSYRLTTPGGERMPAVYVVVSESVDFRPPTPEPRTATPDVNYIIDSGRRMDVVRIVTEGYDTPTIFREAYQTTPEGEMQTVLSRQLGSLDSLPNRRFFRSETGAGFDGVLNSMAALGIIGPGVGLSGLSCGDGIVQEENGEICDGDAGCSKTCAYRLPSEEQEVQKLIGWIDSPPAVILGANSQLPSKQDLQIENIKLLTEFRHRQDARQKLIQVATSSSGVYDISVQSAAIKSLYEFLPDDAVEPLREKWKRMTAKTRSGGCISSKPFCADEYLERWLISDIEEFFKRKGELLEFEQPELRVRQSACPKKGVGGGSAVSDEGQPAQSPFDYKAEFNCLSYPGSRPVGRWPPGEGPKLTYETVSNIENMKLGQPKTGGYGQLIEYDNHPGPSWTTSQCEVYSPGPDPPKGYNQGDDYIKVYLFKDPDKIQKLIDSELRTHASGLDRGVNHISGYYVSSGGYLTSKGEKKFPGYYYYVSSSGSDVDLIYVQRVGTNCVLVVRPTDVGRQSPGPSTRDPFIYPTQKDAEQAKRTLISRLASDAQKYAGPVAGICSPGPAQCSDTDGGLNYYQEGSAENIGRFEYGRDVCASNTQLQEFSCGSVEKSVSGFTSEIQSKYTKTVIDDFNHGSGYYDCSKEGLVCKNGACVCPKEEGKTEKFTVNFEGGSVEIETYKYKDPVKNTEIVYTGYVINYGGQSLTVPNEAGIKISDSVYLDNERVKSEAVRDFEWLVNILKKIKDDKIDDALTEYNNYPYAFRSIRQTSDVYGDYVGLPNFNKAYIPGWGRTVMNDLNNIVSIILLQKARAGDVSKVYSNVVLLAEQSAKFGGFRSVEEGGNLQGILNQLGLLTEPGQTTILSDGQTQSGGQVDANTVESAFVNLEKSMATILVKTLLIANSNGFKIGEIDYTKPAQNPNDPYREEYGGSVFEEEVRKFTDVLTVLSLLDDLLLYDDAIAFLEGAGKSGIEIISAAANNKLDWGKKLSFQSSSGTCGDKLSGDACSPPDNGKCKGIGETKFRGGVPYFDNCECATDGPSILGPPCYDPKDIIESMSPTPSPYKPQYSCGKNNPIFEKREVNMDYSTGDKNAIVQNCNPPTSLREVGCGDSESKSPGAFQISQLAWDLCNKQARPQIAGALSSSEFCYNACPSDCPNLKVELSDIAQPPRQTGECAGSMCTLEGAENSLFHLQGRCSFETSCICYADPPQSPTTLPASVTNNGGGNFSTRLSPITPSRISITGTVPLTGSIEKLNVFRQLKDFHGKIKKYVNTPNIGWTGGFGLERSLYQFYPGKINIPTNWDGFNLLKVYAERKFSALGDSQKLGFVNLIKDLAGLATDEGFDSQMVDILLSTFDQGSLQTEILDALGEYDNSQLAFNKVKTVFENKDSKYSEDVENKALSVLAKMNNPAAKGAILDKGWIRENKALENRQPIDLVRGGGLKPKIYKIQSSSLKLPDSVLPGGQLTIPNIVLLSGDSSQASGAIVSESLDPESLELSLNPSEVDKLEAKLITQKETKILELEETGPNTLEFTYKGGAPVISGSHGDRVYFSVGDIVKEIEIVDPARDDDFIDPSFAGIVNKIKDTIGSLASMITEKINLELHQTPTTPEKKIFLLSEHKSEKVSVDGYVSSVSYEVSSTGNLVNDFVEIKLYKGDTIVDVLKAEDLGHKSVDMPPERGFFKPVNKFVDKAVIVYSGTADEYTNKGAKIAFYTHKTRSPTAGVYSLSLNVKGGDVSSAFLGQSEDPTLTVITNRKFIE